MMIKKIFKRRLNRREKAIAQVCCVQVAEAMRKRKETGEISEIETKILPELEEIIQKLEIN